MAVVTLDFGSKVDMLNKSELQEALAEDAKLRAVVAGVKLAEQWHNLQQTGGASLVYTTPAGSPYSPAQGYVWAIMNIGFELAVSSNVRIYKGVPSLGAANAPIGGGRAVGITPAASVVPAVTFSKGQLTLRAGDQLTFVAVTASAFVLSVFVAAIEVPAERIGELFL